MTYVMQGSSQSKALDTFHLIFAPSYSCNLKCKHCYLPPYSERLIAEEMALSLVEQWNKIVLRERGKYGGIFHIKGGEPFMYPYLWNIIDRLKKLQSLKLMITTNGTFIDREIFIRLSDVNKELNGNIAVIVSLDGASEKTNSILRGKGQFNTTRKFLKGLKEYGINYYLNCVLHKGNIDEVSDYLEFASIQGATQVNFLNFIPRGKGLPFKDYQIPHIDIYYTFAFFL